jgi:WD40 repeat protein
VEDDSAWGVAFDPAGPQVAAVGFNGPAIFSLDGAILHSLSGFEGWINSLAYTPDGAALASAGSDSVVRLWDPATGRQAAALIDPGSGEHTGIAVSGDGRWLATGNVDGRARIWRLGEDGGAAPRHVLVGHEGPVLDVAFDSSGTLLATSSEDGTLRLWEVDTGLERLVVARVDDVLTSVAFSPDGTRLAVGGEGSLRAYTLDIDELLAIAGSRATRGLTGAECQRYLRLAVCPTEAP